MPSNNLKYDYLIIGAGIVGLSTAWQLVKRRPRARILLLEKESIPARHQSGHNSGVIHAGVYYEPGSLKARFCREGAQATYSFCKEHDVPFERTGKLIVATDSNELERMHTLFLRCRENGLQPQLLTVGQMKKREPAVSGMGAFLVAESGISNYPMICNVMLQQFRRMGGEVRFSSQVERLAEGQGEIRVGCGELTFKAEQVVVCGGLMADRLAKLQGLDINFRIIPYRGEYYRLCSKLSGLVNHLVYPVPDPSLPFLGVHLTRMVDGGITVGPNAVQGWKREGYGTINFKLRDTLEMLRYPGFWKASRQHLRQGILETRNSWWKRGYLSQIQKYCPQVGLNDLEPYPAGIRAQAVLADGTMIHDFLMLKTDRSLHVCNAPSPAATSAIPIGRHICDKLLN